MVVTIFIILHFIIYGIVSVGATYEGDAPCWCNGLKKNVNHAQQLLLDRYSLEALQSTSTYFHKKTYRILVDRIYKRLQMKEPLRIVDIGSNNTLRMHSSNNYIANVTRVINDILSASECYHNTTNIEYSNTCVAEDAPHCSKYELSHFSHLPSTFCSRYDSDSRYHDYKYHPTSKPSSEICDNFFMPYKRCAVYEGSGKYATVTASGKGGTTIDVTIINLHVRTIPAEEIDIFFWDFSTNDYPATYRDVSGRYPNIIRSLTTFMDTALTYTPNIAAFAFVYWFDEQEDYTKNCNDLNASNVMTNDTLFKEVFSNKVASYHYPILQHLFGENGRLSNRTSLLTMSLPQFCYHTPSKRCHLHDFIHPLSNHPSDRGSSVFADLIIWNLLKVLDVLLLRYCFEKDDSRLHATNHNATHGHHLHTAFKAFKSNECKDAIHSIDQYEINHNGGDRPGVIVLGMHRSGTSTLGGLINMMGLKTGGPLIGPAKDNAKGFFERIDVVVQNDKIMGKQSVSYGHRTHAYDALKGLKDILSEYDQTFFSDGRRGLAFLNDQSNYPWMLKDPRLCITFRTWLPLLKFSPAILFSYRHPMDVALSLKTRHEHYPIDTSLRMWYVYNRRAIQQSHDLCRVTTSYKRIMSDAKVELQRIYGGLFECGVEVPHMITDQQVESFIDPSLQHGKSDLIDNMCSSDIKTISPDSKMWPDPDAKQLLVFRTAMTLYCALEDDTAYDPDFQWDMSIIDG